MENYLFFSPFIMINPTLSQTLTAVMLCGSGFNNTIKFIVKVATFFIRDL